MRKSGDVTAQERATLHARKTKKLFDMQISPLKALPMTMFMLYMVGNEIQIFSIMFVGMSIISPITTFFQAGSSFAMFAGDDTVRSEVTRAKLCFQACCCVALAVGLVKLSWMGLLPTAAVDWMDHSRPFVVERSWGSVL